MRPVAAVLASVLTVCVFNASSFAADGGKLPYRQTVPPTIPQEGWGGLDTQVLEIVTTKPAVRAEPAYAGAAVYFLAELGEKETAPYVAVYDRKGGRGKGCVYFDVDHDGDLAEEEPLLPQWWAGGDYFGPIPVQLTREGKTGLYHCWLRVWPSVLEKVAVEGASASSDVSVTGDLWPGCMNLGEITLEGKTYRAATVDAGINGRFNDLCWSTAYHTTMVDAKDPWQSSYCTRLGGGDVLLVDWNGDGKFDMNADEYVLVGKRYWRDGKWYRLHFSTDGTEVTFATRDFELAPVVTGHDRFWMQVTSKSNVGSVWVEGTGGRVDLPVDTYGLYLAWLEARDAQGNTWKAETFRRGPHPDFQVTAGQENRCLFGPPFTLSLEVPERRPEGPYRPGMHVDLRARLTGREGKTYVFTRNGQDTPGPKLVLRDESGKKVAPDNFLAYPTGGIFWCSWQIPANVHGKVTVTVSIDVGPFAWKAEDLVLEVK